MLKNQWQLHVFALFSAKYHFYTRKICRCQNFVVPLHPLSKCGRDNGRLPEWLGTGLQNRGQRFESATDLHKNRQFGGSFCL